MHVTRRDFMKGMGALAGIASVNVNFSIIAAAADVARGAAATMRGVVRVKSTCAHCVNFCGIDVTVVNGVIRTIYPDKARAEYYNRGLCPKGVSGMFNTYNPYRLKVPLKRTNPRKGQDQDPRWVEISWDEAFDTIAVRLKKIKQENPSKFIWQHGHGKYLIRDHFPKAFAAAFGTPNVVHRTTTCEAARHVADELTWGYHAFLPDLEHTNLLVNFGANYFEGEQWSRWLDYATTIARERGMKVVVIEPRLSNCAAKADEWISIRPGKDTTFILAMAKVLIDDGTIDEEFLITYTNAPNLVSEDGKLAADKEGKPLVWDAASNSARPFVDGVKPALRGSYQVESKPYRTAFQVFADSLKELTPQYAEDVAGVPAVTVTRLAREMATQARIGSTIQINGQKLRYRPVAIHTFRGLAAKEFGVQNWRAGQLLQMLLGGQDAVGGMNLHGVYRSPKYFEAAKCEYPPKRADLAGSVYFPNSHHDIAQQVSLTILDPNAYGLDYQPEMQIFYATNRPFSTADTEKQFEGLAKTFNVAIDIVMSEVAWYSDIVLPDNTYLEAWHWSDTRWTPASGHSAIRQPVTNVYNLSHEAFSILWELAKRLDLRNKYIENINKNFNLKEQALAPGRDYTAKEVLEKIWVQSTKKDFNYALEHAFVGKKVGTADRYLKGVEDKFKGPGKPKMKFYADQMMSTFDKVAETVNKNGISNIDLAKYRLALSPIPLKDHAFPTPHREARNLPFYLVTHKLMWRNQSGNTATNPILNALADTKENYVVMNRATGKQLGIKTGDTAVIETRIGKVEGKAKLVEGIRPDTVAVSYHYGHWSLGLPDYARTGINVNRVMESHPDVVSGMESFNDTKCKVYKA